MLLKNGLILSKDLSCLISSCLTPNEMTKASQVCKNWNQFFSSDLVWKEKLQNSGLIKLDEIKKKLFIPTYKDLYKSLIAIPRFKNIFFKRESTINLSQVDINPICLQKIAESIYSNQLTDHTERRKECTTFLYRSGLRIYNSLPQFVTQYLLGNDYIINPQTLDGNLLEVLHGNQENLLDKGILKLVRGNKNLYESIQGINNTEFNLFNLFYALLNQSGHMIAGSQSKCYSALIPSEKGKVYFNWTHETCLTPFGQEKLGTTTNCCVNFTVEIDDSGFSLINYNVAVSKKFYDIASEVLNNEQLLDTFQDIFMNGTNNKSN